MSYRIDVYDLADDHSLMRDRRDELLAWASNRISCCHAALTGRNGYIDAVGRAAYEAERRALEAAVRIIKGEPTP